MTVEAVPQPAPPAAQRPEGSVSKPPVALPFWLRSRPKRPSALRAAPTPRELRWWVGVAWLLISALALGFVAHVTLVGSLQHSRAQYVLYQELRTSLALATTPLGQLDVDGVLVPNGTPIAYLTIDRIGVAEVIVQGTRSGDLTNGPGHRRDTVMPGQEGTSVILGRQATYGGPFSLIGALDAGDVIEVTTGQGLSRYEVIGVRQEGDLLPQPVGEGEGRLELVTADGIPLAPSGTVYVDAELITEVKETPSPVFTKAVLDPAELAMASDPSAWFGILFWLQWLVASAVALRWVRSRWGMWQTWVIAIPILLALGAATAGATMALLPNLL